MADNIQSRKNDNTNSIEHYINRCNQIFKNKNNSKSLLLYSLEEN